MIKKILSLLLLVISIGVISYTASSHEIGKEEVNKQINQIVFEEVSNNLDTIVSNYINIDDLNKIRELRKIKNNEATLMAETNKTEYQIIRKIIHDTQSSAEKEFKELIKDNKEIKIMLDTINNKYNSAAFTNGQRVNNYSLSNDLRNILISAGLSIFAINIIVGSFEGSMAVASQWWLFGNIKAIIIGGLLTAATVTIILNWDKIAPVFNELVNILKEGLRSFVQKVISFTNTIIEKVQYLKINVKIIMADIIRMSVGLIKNKNYKVFHMAYVKTKKTKKGKVYKSELVIEEKYPLNYLEAFAYLKLIVKNLNILMEINDQIEKIILNDTLTKNIKKVPADKIGVYTDDVINAGSLAKFVGCTNLSNAEIHGTVENGYYPHYHDPKRRMHIWFKDYRE